MPIVAGIQSSVLSLHVTVSENMQILSTAVLFLHGCAILSYADKVSDSCLSSHVGH